MDFPALAEALHAENVQACNIGHSGRGFQVSILRRGAGGWEVYYGDDLGETVERAVTHGPQLAPDPEEWGGLV